MTVVADPSSYALLEKRLRLRETYYPAHDEPEWSLLQQTLDSVVDRLWTLASTEGPHLPPEYLEAFGERPVFVVGYYKSGTTLLLNLLDGHPELLALPGEWRHFTGQAVHGEDAIRAVHSRAIRNAITPYGIPPRWLLGNPAETAVDRYDELGRAVVGFARARGSRDVLAAAAQGFAAVTVATPKHWVEKTPTQELLLEQILAAYPEARFVHIVRDPHATLGSIRDYKSGVPIADSLTGAAELDRSLRAAVAGRRRVGDRYTIVKYEDLVTETAATMRTVAAALEIAYEPQHLLVPTTLGAPATANAGRPERRVSGAVHTLSLERASASRRRDRLVVDALAGRSANALGYDVGKRNTLVAAAARAVLFMRYRITPILLRDRRH